MPNWHGHKKVPGHKSQTGQVSAAPAHGPAHVIDCDTEFIFYSKLIFTTLEQILWSDLDNKFHVVWLNQSKQNKYGSTPFSAC